MNLLKSEKPLVLSGFLLKVLAFFFMTLDHIGAFMQAKGIGYEAADVLRILGRIAFPLFVFLLVEGMRLSHHKEKYLLRIGLMYGIITIPETLIVYIPAFAQALGVSPATLDPHPFADIFFLGIMLYFLNQQGWKKAFALLPMGYFIASFYFAYFDFGNPYFPYYLRSGYDLFALVLALALFGVHRLLDKKEDCPQLLRNLGTSAMVGLSVLVCFLISLGVNRGMLDFMRWEAWACLSIPLLLLYSGKRGYDSTMWRIFSYSYFLLHMAVLYIVFSLL